MRPGLGWDDWQPGLGRAKNWVPLLSYRRSGGCTGGLSTGGASRFNRNLLPLCPFRTSGDAHVSVSNRLPVAVAEGVCLPVLSRLEQLLVVLARLGLRAAKSFWRGLVALLRSLTRLIRGLAGIAAKPMFDAASLLGRSASSEKPAGRELRNRMLSGRSRRPRHRLRFLQRLAG